MSGRGITKRSVPSVGGRIKRYRNLAAFNSECTSRGYRGNSCELTNLRCTKNGWWPRNSEEHATGQSHTTTPCRHMAAALRKLLYHEEPLAQACDRETAGDVAGRAKETTWPWVKK